VNNRRVERAGAPHPDFQICLDAACFKASSKSVQCLRHRFIYRSPVGNRNREQPPVYEPVRIASNRQHGRPSAPEPSGDGPKIAADADAPNPFTATVPCTSTGVDLNLIPSCYNSMCSALQPFSCWPPPSAWLPILSQRQLRLLSVIPTKPKPV
jgi:hypothetical protein